MIKNALNSIARMRAPAAQVAVVRLQGVLATSGSRSINLANVARNLDKAFDLPNLKAVALVRMCFADRCSHLVAVSDCK
jgi:ClpP class serine protease